MSRINDFKAIEKSIIKYLEKEFTLFQLIHNIEILANATFDLPDTEEFYVFLINSIGDLECEYFMKADEVTNDEYLNYREELITLAQNFKKELQKFKKSFIDKTVS